MRYGIGTHGGNAELTGVNLIAVSIVALICLVICIAYVLELLKQRNNYDR